MKRAFRKEALARRSAIPAALRSEKSARIRSHVLSLPETRAAGVISIYVDFRSEVETRELIQALLQQGKTVAVPVVHFDTWELSFTAIDSLDSLVETEKHLMEPAPGTGRDIPLEALDLILTPGAAFDRRGYRMGYGGGFYDRLLSRKRPDAKAFALAFSEQLVPEVPTDPHDQPLNGIITEEGLLRI